MIDPHQNLTTEQEIRGETHAPYMTVFWLVLGLTALEYAYATFTRVGFGTLVGGLMAMAMVKVFLVGWYFMHLKFANKWVYLMLAPAAVLSVVVVAALVPDMVFPPR